MKQAFLLTAITLSLLASSLQAETAEQSAKIKVLDQWLGTWNVQVDLKPSLWIPDGKKQRESKKVEWILAGQFQQTAISSDAHESREIQRYDKGSKKYQKWIFDTDGNTSDWTGIWNEVTGTMTWTIDSEYVNGTIVERFISADKFESTIIVTTKEGNLLLYGTTEQTRKNEEL